MKIIPPSIISIKKTQKNFIWNGLNPTIQNSVMNKNYRNGGLKNINITAKISNLQSSWIKRLFKGNFHDWKILPLHIIHKSLRKKFVFYSNLQINKKLTKNFPKYYKETNTWGSKFSCQTSDVSRRNLGIAVLEKQVGKQTSFNKINYIANYK